MVGAAASGSKVRAGDSRFTPMYSLVLPTAVRLSVSGDALCSQLFHTLLYQVVRWFAGRDNVHESESAVLLDTLIDGLSDTSDAKLRNQVCGNILVFFLTMCVLYHRMFRAVIHYTTLHYTTLHYTTLHYTTLQCPTLHYTRLDYNLHCTTPHCTTLDCTTPLYTTAQYNTRHYTTLHYTILHHR